MTRPTTRIAPCLWLDDQAEAAAAFYTAIVPGSRVVAVSRYPAHSDNPAGKARGSILTVEFELAGCPFTALNGGPTFTPNPAISFFVYTRDIAETDRIASALVAGGSYLMGLDAYPWSGRYAWVQDRYGVSWQVMLADREPGEGTIAPCLMFAGALHGRAEEALRLYARTFPDGKVTLLERYGADEGPEGTLKHGRVSLSGQPLVTMDSHGAHDFTFTEGVSLQVHCRDQAEVDHYWSTLSDGGEEGQCGWLKDRFGVSWQVVPTALIDMLTSGGGSGPGFERAFQAVLGMNKLDMAALQAAYDGES